MARKGWWEKLLEDKQSQVDETLTDYEKEQQQMERDKRPKPEPEDDDEGFLMKTLRAFTSRSKKR